MFIEFKTTDMVSTLKTFNINRIDMLYPCLDNHNWTIIVIHGNHGYTIAEKYEDVRDAIDAMVNQ